MKFLDREINKGEKVKFDFEIIDDYKMPLWVICGTNQGQTLVLTAGVHGCEYVGIQTASLATLDWEAVVAMLEKLALENVTPNAIITHAKAATVLRTTLKDSVAGAEYLMQNGTMAGLPVSTTNQLEAKTGTPATGRVLAGDFSQLVVGEWGSAEVLANPYAPDYYERGDIQLRIMATMDMAVRNAKAFVLADDLAL